MEFFFKAPEKEQAELKEQDIITQLSLLMGRLSQFFERWEVIISDPLILPTIKGYELPFHF